MCAIWVCDINVQEHDYKPKKVKGNAVVPKCVVEAQESERECGGAKVCCRRA